MLTTCTSNGSVNCMHDSLNPLTGLMPMIGMWLNTTFGGVGVGMINMFLYIVLAVFVAGHDGGPHAGIVSDGASKRSRSSSPSSRCSPTRFLFSRRPRFLPRRRGARTR